MYTKERPGYYMNIPAEVWDSEISAKAMILYGHISVLVNKKKYCFAGNKYFEDVMKCSAMTINRCLIELEENKFITRKLIFKENSKEVEVRKIYINVGITSGEASHTENDNRPHTKNGKRSHTKYVIDNTKISNTTSINSVPPLSR